MADMPAPHERAMRVRELFDLALDSPSGGVDAVLSAHASDDLSLIAEVKELLAAHSEATGFLSVPAIYQRTSGTRPRSRWSTAASA